MLSQSLPLAYWIHKIDPFLVKFPKGFFLEGIRWYGVAYFLAFIIAAILLYLYYKKGKSSINPDQQATLLSALIIGVLVGGRLGYMIFYDLNNFVHNPLIFFQIYKGGMSSHGGFIGVILSLVWFSHHTKHSFLKLLDIIATLAPPGFLLGRIANFINGELWGKVSYISWGVIFPLSAPPGTPISLIPPRHPSQLYAAFLEGLVLLIYSQYRFWGKSPNTPPGQLAGEVITGYALLRILDEVFREPDASLILGMSRGQFYSILLALIGIGFIVASKKFKRN